MTQEDYNWLDQNKLFMYQSQYMSKEERYKLYEIYNRITGENKRPNSCGKCLRTTLNILKHHYENFQRI